MDFIVTNGMYAIGLFVGMLTLLETGRRIGMRRLARDPEGAHAGTGAIEGAIFGLMGLILAFTFYGASSRLDARRQLIIEETNAIGTAYLRLDQLPASAQPALRDHFRRYLNARLQVYRRLPDKIASAEELANANKLQEVIWREAVASSRLEGADPSAAMLLLPALNSMIDITTSRKLAMQIHPPTVVFVMLFALCLISSLLAGHGMAGSKSRNWLYMAGFGVVMAVSVFVILDMEFPRMGFIRVDDFDQALVDLLESMK